MIRKVNMSFSIKLDEARKHVVIRLPIEKLRPSASGKTLVLATSGGCKSGEAVYRGRPVAVAASAFIFPDKQRKSNKGKSKSRLKSGRGAKSLLRPPEDQDAEK
jgi:hypothetical protein